MIEGPSPVVAVALHNGAELRPELAALCGVSPAERRREEDPYTGRLAEAAPTHVIVHRSRFEVDLNRPPKEALYLDADDSWGLELWPDGLESAARAASEELHDAFYVEMERVLGRVEAREGRFVVLDVHSYNHRREGTPADPAGNPDVNVGTGSLDRDRWGHVVDRFISDLSAHPLGLDVRENVRFKGRHLAAWVHERFSRSGCCLALEFKKTFMDEWTGELHRADFDALRGALASTLPGLGEELAR